MPSHTRWLWRATGLLARDPALAGELAEIGLAPGATDKARALVLDLLVSVGHAEAQAALRTVLGAPTLAKSAARPVLLQRVSFLDTPEPATVDAVWQALRDGKQRGWNDLVATSAHSLAAASRAMASRGDEAGARAMVLRLGRENEAAPTPASKAALLGALANASSPEVVPIASPLSSSDDPALREAAATSLRKVSTREATELLLTLLGDPVTDVQGAALASLRDHPLSESDWAGIAGLEASGRLGPSLDGAMLTLATDYVGRMRAVARVVATIAARPESSAATRARAQSMLASAQG